MFKKSHCKVLILATNSEDANIFIWSVATAGSYEIYALGASVPNSELKFHPWIKEFYEYDTNWTLREGEARGLLDRINYVVRQNDIDVIVPTGFESLKFFVCYQSELSLFAKIIFAPSLEQIETLNDKFQFMKFCQGVKVPIPRTILLDSVSRSVLDLKQNPGFPLVTKPLAMSGGKGIHKFDSEEALREYLLSPRGDRSNCLPLLLQEFVPGIDYELNAYVVKGEIRAWTIQEFLETPCPFRDMLRWYRFVENKNVLDLGTEIIKQIHYSGPINIAFRQDSRDGSFKAIEVNPRFWASTFYSVIDGVNFVDAAIKISFNENYSCSPKCSQAIWGSPHWLPFLLMTSPIRKFWGFLRAHSVLQVKYLILSLFFSFLVKVKMLLRCGKLGTQPETPPLAVIPKSYFYIRLLGLRHLFRKTILKIMSRAKYYEILIFAKSLASTPKAEIRLAPSFRVVRLQKKDIVRLPHMTEPGRISALEARIENEACYAVEDAGKVCSYAWILRGPQDVAHELRNFSLGSREAYVHDCYTLPEYRGRKLLPGMLSVAESEYRQQDYVHFFTIIYSDNISSMRAFLKLDYKLFKVVGGMQGRVL